MQTLNRAQQLIQQPRRGWCACQSTASPCRARVTHVACDNVWIVIHRLCILFFFLHPPPPHNRVEVSFTHRYFTKSLLYRGGGSCAPGMDFITCACRSPLGGGTLQVSALQNNSTDRCPVFAPQCELYSFRSQNKRLDGLGLITWH